tara:strand:- start:366 stop:611 length:246 start_codon:yes stop_codon:yes gene_type:complete
MKIWISKYALSAGITEHECEPPDEGSDRVCPGAPFMSFASFKLGRDAHVSRDDAVKAAESARTKKIASVRKQITRLEATVF